jgi:hypothetical protein
LTNKEYERHAVAARYSARHTPKGDFDEQGVENASEENPGRRSTTSLRRHAAIARYTPRGAVDEQGVQASRRRRPLQCMPSLAVEVKRTYGGGRRGGRGCGVCNGLTPVRPCIGAAISPLARIVRTRCSALSVLIHRCSEEPLDDRSPGRRSRQMTTNDARLLPAWPLGYRAGSERHRESLRAPWRNLWITRPPPQSADAAPPQGHLCNTAQGQPSHRHDVGGLSLNA